MLLRSTHAARFAALLGAALLLSEGVNAADHNVQVGPGTTFTPSDLTVAQGDTVIWTWAGGLHSVTSGTNSNPAIDPNAGVEFDSGTLFNPPTPFSHTFNSTGDFPYFCNPHFGLGMTAVVHVTAAVPVPSMGLWALLSTAMLMAAAGFWIQFAHRRRHCRAPKH